MKLLFQRSSVFSLLFVSLTLTVNAQDGGVLRDLWKERNSIDIVHRSLQDSLTSRKALLDSIISGEGISTDVKNKLQQFQANKFSKGNLLSLLSFSGNQSLKVPGKPRFDIRTTSASALVINDEYFTRLPEISGNLQLGGVPFQFNHVVQYHSTNGWDGIPLKFRFDKNTHLSGLKQKFEQQFNVKKTLQDQINFRQMAESMLEQELQQVQIGPNLLSTFSDAGLGVRDILLLNQETFENRYAKLQSQLATQKDENAQRNLAELDTLRSLYQKIHLREKDLFKLLNAQNSLTREIDQIADDEQYIRSGSQLIKQNGFQRFFTKLNKFDVGRMGFHGGFNDFIDGFGSGLLMQGAGKLGLGTAIQVPQMRSAFRDGKQLPMFSDLSGVNLNLFRQKQNHTGDNNLIGLGYSMERSMGGVQQSPFVVPANILNLQLKREFSWNRDHRVQISLAKSMRQYVSDQSNDGFKTSIATLGNFFRDSRVGLRYTGNLPKLGLNTLAAVDYSGIGYSNTNVFVNRSGRWQYQVNARKSIPYFKYSYLELGWRRIDQDFVTTRMETNRFNSKLNLRINKLVRVLAFADGGVIRYPGLGQIADVRNLFAQASVMTKGHIGYLPLDHSISFVVSKNSVSDLLLPTGISSMMSMQHTGTVLLGKHQLLVKNGLARNEVGQQPYWDYLGTVSYNGSLLQKILWNGGLHYTGNGPLARQLGASIQLNGAINNHINWLLSFDQQMNLITNQNPYAFPNQRGTAGIVYKW